MKIKTILIAGVLPIALFAKDDDMAGKIVPRLVDSKSTELNQTIDGINDFASEAEAQTVGKFVINESNFTHKKTKSRKAKATPKVEKIETIAKQDLINESVTANLGTEDGINSDSLDTEEAVREYAEADADIKATTDSASTGAPAKLFVLDMTTSIIPTESRRIAGHYGPRKHRMHRGVDLGLCHGENRTIVAAFAGKVVKVRNQGRRKGYGRYVILDHGNGLTTLYAHLERWKVKVARPAIPSASEAIQAVLSVHTCTLKCATTASTSIPKPFTTLPKARSGIFPSRSTQTNSKKLKPPTRKKSARASFTRSAAAIALARSPTSMAHLSNASSA